MLTFLIVVGSIALLFLCAWLILLILMQKPSANAGMGAALGGGAAESAFGGEASNVLTRWTVYGVIGFFVLALTLSLAQIYRHHHDESKKELAPMAEEVAETPKSLTELPTDGDGMKVDAAKKAENESVKTEVAKATTPKAETSKPKTPKVETKKAENKKSNIEKDTSKKAATEGEVLKETDTAKVDASKKPSKSKISYRSDTKRDTKPKSASSGKSGSKNADAKEAVVR
ncbi:MAG: preprotein translocase subunit SecG [Opitutales bacterium]|nr:preprotein translocase subunit SecG [Opitutales bacterium]